MPIENKSLPEAVKFYGSQAFFAAGLIPKYANELLWAIMSLDAAELHTQIAARIAADFPDVEIEQAIFEINGEQLKNFYLSSAPEDIFKARFNSYDWGIAFHSSMAQRTFTMNARKSAFTKEEVPLKDTDSKIIYLVVGLQKDLAKINDAVKLEEDCYTTFRTLVMKAMDEMVFDNTPGTHFEYRLPLLHIQHGVESMDAKLRNLNNFVHRVDPDSIKITYDLVYDEDGSGHGGPGWPLVKIRKATLDDIGRTKHGL